MKFLFKILFFTLFFTLIFQNKYTINSFQLNELYPFTLLLSSGDLFLITANGFRLYDSTFKIKKNSYDFTSNEAKINSEAETELVSLAQYQDGTIIALVKNILYVFNIQGNYILEQNLNEYLSNAKYYSLIAYKHDSSSSFYYYIVSFFDNRNITIKYFSFSKDRTLTVRNPITFLTYKPLNSQGGKTEILEYGLSCEIMIKDGNEVLTCFYQLSYPNELGVSSYLISNENITEINLDKIFSSNNQSSIIKSVVSSDKKKSLICYTQYYTYSVCLQYDIDSNTFTPEIQYFNKCKGMATGIYVYYFQSKNKYMFICHNNAKGFNVVLFDSNFHATIPNSGDGKSEPYYNYGGNCYNIYNFNIVYLSNIDDYILINDCNIGNSEVITGSINLEKLSENNNFPTEEDVDIFYNKEIISDDNQNNKPSKQHNINITYGTTTKTKDEIINDIDEIIKDKNPEKTYIIDGEDFTIIIKQVDTYVEESTVNIDFSECEKLLKEKYPSKEYRILEVIIENNNDNCLTDQVEYKIYDQFGEKVDLSICKDIDIIIEYEIKNTSLLNIEQISNYIGQGIDVFNLSHTFFNDICYPYSDNNSDSDMILTDRVADIYQNYSICGEECEYESFNIEKMSVSCNCKVKQEVSSEIEEGNFKTYIVGTFVYSNFGVAKCYNLFFSLNGKLENAGFWIFGIMIIFHAPIYVFYFINGVNPVFNYINKEMENNGYKYKSSLIFPRIQTTSQNLKESRPGPKSKNSKKNTNKNPPKKNKPKNNLKNNKKSINEENNPNNFSIQKNINNTINKKGNMLLINQINEQKHKLDPEKDNSKKISNLTSQNKQIRNKKSSIKLDKEQLNKFQIKNLKNKDNTIETNLNASKVEKGYQFSKEKEEKNDVITEVNEKNERIINKKTKKNKYNINKLKNNLITELESGELLTQNNEAKNRLQKKKKLKNKDMSNNTVAISGEKEINKVDTISKIEFPLIRINANNTNNHEPIKSNYILNNYDFNEAIVYDKRSFCRIFYIYLISKENNLNIIVLNPPLELKPLRICIFIFSYACDIALNAFFFLSDNISDKYHYIGDNRLLYSLINNLSISLISAFFSFILLCFFQSLVQSSNKIEKLFRQQEKLLKSDKKYKVNETTKLEIYKKLGKIMKCLKIKISVFIVLESLFILFFFYYVTAFCQVYQKTQVSWLLDCLSSYLISLFFILLLTFICSLLYKLSIKCKIEILYNIITFIYASI